MRAFSILSIFHTLLLSKSFLLAAGAVPSPSCSNTTTCQFNVNLKITDLAGLSYVEAVKNVRLPISGRTYRYVFRRPSVAGKPYLLFLHGFPETSYVWVNQIEYFTGKGYGIVAPDLFGFGGTDKSLELEDYNHKALVDQVVELLNCEGVSQVIPVTQDFGSVWASRLHSYYPEYVSALAIMNVGYMPPGVHLNTTFIDTANAETEAQYGYPIYGYWDFFDQEDAYVLVDAHLESIYSLMFSSNTTNARDNFVKPGALQRWLAADRRIDFQGEFTNNSTQARWASITRAAGGLRTALNWYKAYLRNINLADEIAIQSRPGIIEQPVLFVGTTRDPISIPEREVQALRSRASNLRERSVAAGHFLQVVEARQVIVHLEEFFESLGY